VLVILEADTFELASHLNVPLEIIDESAKLAVAVELSRCEDSRSPPPSATFAIHGTISPQERLGDSNNFV
jgi:hypothetical protein